MAEGIAIMQDGRHGQGVGHRVGVRLDVTSDAVSCLVNGWVVDLGGGLEIRVHGLGPW